MPFPKFDPLRVAIQRAYRLDETKCLTQLLPEAKLTQEQLRRVQQRARQLVEYVRAEQRNSSSIDSFMYEYDLSSEEGIALMCLAEALLRIPDKDTIDRLIRDKLTSADWRSHVGRSDSLFVNATTWALMLSGRVLKHNTPNQYFGNSLQRFLVNASQPVIRKAVGRAMQIMSRQFVMGRQIKEAIKRAKEYQQQGYRYSYDMLGEAARTERDAQCYYDSYRQAILTISETNPVQDPIQGSGVSIKLSALHPRYEFSQRKQVLTELVPKVLALAVLAKQGNMGFTIDAEEADRLDLSLDVIERVLSDGQLAGWDGFGVAVQSYQKRAWYVLDWLADLARKNQRRITVRLIKGAYWDTEIKLTQMEGLTGYPVFTRKASTDVSFQACAKKLLTLTDVIYPQFATHNAYSAALILELANGQDFEFQCLHGMGQALYQTITPKNKLNIPCRIYAPVGSHQDLLPYLVRRLLENGANSSFVNRIVDASAPLDDLIADPVAIVEQLTHKPHPKIKLPGAIYGTQRQNSQGVDLTDWQTLISLARQMQQSIEQPWVATPMGANLSISGASEPVFSPTHRDQQIGTVTLADANNVEQALQAATKAFSTWSQQPVEQRAAMLEKAADLLEEQCTHFFSLAIYEAGKTMVDAVAEVREAVDFCRYYAAQARQHLQHPQVLAGYTGELNELSLHGRGTMVCISPWNFPLAIFMGQVTASLVTGNCVIAKPAQQTPLIAARAVAVLHEAGVPLDVLQLLPGSGSTIGAQLIADERIDGVLFTGSTATARLINKTLAERQGSIVPLIAETGGQNAMIVDSSALLEQAVLDIIQSAFGSTGQRCSALRVLFVQQDVADQLIEMLVGAMQELIVGDPQWLETDLGPVIDASALTVLQEHKQRMQRDATLICEAVLSDQCHDGTFFAPCLFELDSIEQLTREVFGPCLHVIRYKQLDQAIEQINRTGYGLTLGIHSRVNETVNKIIQAVHVGNRYVNRNMTGAIVGLQPFGGEGLSGTGPKAGGPHYLLRLCNERTLTINTTAAGGNASLMSLQD
ncbi:MAG: bifunctional proline dehydrogenase/L-glutamate gamma-semialdehyde dehydrogenase PutA [Legionellales bacterium]|nr:bifunctional proline dehydrogenase/L-glutamate gamma-semialdehyde dehydrogenase PutA [Legionellales bacterium]